MSKLDIEGGYLFSQGVSVFECSALLMITLTEKHEDFKRMWRFCLVSALYDLLRQIFRASYDIPASDYWGFAAALLLEVVTFIIQRARKR